ncbi:hypothetical protein SXANM310S_02696 [Streptomyces xanthochromogenes]
MVHLTAATDLAESRRKFAHALPGIIGAWIVPASQRVDDLQAYELLAMIQHRDQGIGDRTRPVIACTQRDGRLSPDITVGVVDQIQQSLTESRCEVCGQLTCGGPPDIGYGVA